MITWMTVDIFIKQGMWWDSSSSMAGGELEDDMIKVNL